MATFEEITKRSDKMAKDISDHTGVGQMFALNIIYYARQLTLPEHPELIEDKMFTAQMERRFGIASVFHINLIFGYVCDKKNTKYARVEDYARMVCILCCDNLDLKVDLVFSTYDYNRDGFIVISEIYQLLKSSILHVGDDEHEEMLKDLVDLVIKLIDTNADGKISRSEFKQFVKKNVLFIEILGPILPSDSAIKDFISIIQTRTADSVKKFFRTERRRCLHDPIQPHSLIQDLYPISLELP